MRNGAACLIALLTAGSLLGSAAEDSQPESAGSKEAALQHAEALIRQNKPFEAAVELSAMLESSPDWVPGLKVYARLMAYTLDNQTRAELLLQKCLKLAPSDPEVWQDLGNLYLGERRNADAIHYFEAGARLAPRDAVLEAHLAMAYSQAGQAAKAADLYRRSIEMNRQAAKPDSRVPLLYAEYLLGENDAAGSIRLFTESLRLNARSSEANFGRARAHERLRQWQEAAADGLNAIRYAPGRLDANLLLLRVYQALHDQAKVEEYSAQVKRLNEERRAHETAERNSREALRLYMEVVQPLLQKQKCEEAIQPSLEIVKLWPSFAQPLFVLGVCYGQTGQPDQAVSFLKKFLSLQPNSGDGHAALGALLLQQNRKQEAREELERAVTLDPGESEARRLLDSLGSSAPQPGAGRGAASMARAPASGSSKADVQAAATLMEQGNFLRASKMLEAAIASNPSCDADVYIMLATCRSNLKQGAEAIRVSERGLEHNPRSPRLEEFYVSMLRAWSGKAESKAKLVQSLRQDPDSPVYLMALSALLLQQNAVGLAAQIEPLVKKAALARPLDPEAHYLYGQWACLNARHDECVREMSRALELTRNNDRANMLAHGYLGLTYEASHQTVKAELEYQKAVELDRKLAPFEPVVFLDYASFLEGQQREGDSQKVILELLRRAPTFGKAHLARAQYLSRQNKMEEALSEGELALKYSGQDARAQRAAHIFLARICHVLGRGEEARLHQDWVKAQARP